MELKHYFAVLDHWEVPPFVVNSLRLKHFVSVIRHVHNRCRVEADIQRKEIIAHGVKSVLRLPGSQNPINCLHDESV
jgi:hypothetical protein